MTKALEPALPPQLLPDPATLSGPQLNEQHCALCGVRLYKDRFLGTVNYIDLFGNKATANLWGCAPACPTVVRPRRRTS
ncbi:hypothetical protein [Streptomyces chartreusis]